MVRYAKLSQEERDKSVKRMKEWRASRTPEQKEKLKAAARKRQAQKRYGFAAHKKRRKAVLEAYGAACACCGEKTEQFLCIDHTNGDGAKHRKQNPGMNIYFYLYSRGMPKEGFRILCHNCNLSRGYYGYCPHEFEQL